MGVIEITALSLKLISLGLNAAEAAQVGDLEAAKKYLDQAAERVAEANAAWDAAAQEGDDVG